MKIVNAIYGQTIEDMAIMYYGCVEGVGQIMYDNQLAGDELLYAGQPILIQDEVPELTINNRVIAAAVKNEAIKPNSHVATDEPDTGHWVESGWVESGYVE